MIDTHRLTLLKPSLADFDEFYAMRSDPALIKLAGIELATREDAWNKLLRNIGQWEAFGYGMFTVRDRVKSNFIGEIGLARFSRGLGEVFDSLPEVAWILAINAHGKGYATEAVVAAHNWMASAHQHSHTVCIIRPDNQASIRIAEKLRYVGIGEVLYRGASLKMFERHSADSF